MTVASVVWLVGSRSLSSAVISWCTHLSSFYFRGEVSSSAYGVLPASLNLRHHGNQRGPQVGHQHQEADTAQHHLVQLRLKHTHKLDCSPQCCLASHCIRMTMSPMSGFKGHFFKVQRAMIFFFNPFFNNCSQVFCAAISQHILTIISADVVHSGCLKNQSLLNRVRGVSSLYRNDLVVFFLTIQMYVWIELSKYKLKVF